MAYPLPILVQYTVPATGEVVQLGPYYDMQEAIVKCATLSGQGFQEITMWRHNPSSPSWGC